MDPQIETGKKYIIQQLRAGLTADTIAGHLRGANWPEASIQAAFQAVQQNFTPQPYNTPIVSSQQPVTSSNPELPASEPVAAQPLEPQTTFQPQPTQVNPQVSALTPAASNNKHGRIRTGWLLFKQSLTVLKGNPQLFRYFIMTGVWIFGITAVFIALYLIFDIKDVTAARNANLRPLGYILGILDYVLIYFFINYYAAGLTANVLDVFQGQHKPYKAYMQVARSKVRAIFVFSLVAATVGMILQYIVERVRWVGWLLSWFLGTLWSLGTLFVIPIIVTNERPNGMSEIKQSVSFFKQTWGEDITAKISVNAPLFLITILICIVYFVLIFPAAILGFFGVAALTLLFFVTILTLNVFGSFANSIVNVALFYFATQHQVPPAFDAELLNKVFVKHKRHFFSRKKS